jgi:quercetin dioxygenase-like cupin family protein
MTERRNAGRRSTRRSLLRNGLATAAAVLAIPELRAVGGEGKGSLQPYEKVEPQKYPWGWIRWLMNGQIDPQAEMTMGLVHIEPNQTNTLHIHPNSAEFLHALSGTSEHRVGSERWVTLKAGDTLHIPRNVPHQARTHDQAFEALIVYDTPTRIMVPVTEETLGEPAKSP